MLEPVTQHTYKIWLKRWTRVCKHHSTTLSPFLYRCTCVLAWHSSMLCKLVIVLTDWRHTGVCMEGTCCLSILFYFIFLFVSRMVSLCSLGCPTHYTSQANWPWTFGNLLDWLYQILELQIWATMPTQIFLLMKCILQRLYVLFYSYVQDVLRTYQTLWIYQAIIFF